MVIKGLFSGEPECTHYISWKDTHQSEIFIVWHPKSVHGMKAPIESKSEKG